MTISEFDKKFKVGDKISPDHLMEDFVYEITDIKIGGWYFAAKRPYPNGVLIMMRNKTCYHWKLVPEPSEIEKEEKIRRNLYAKMLSEFTKYPMDGYKIKLDEPAQKEIDFEKTFAEYKNNLNGKVEIDRLKSELALKDRIINDLCVLLQTYLKTNQRVN